MDQESNSPYIPYYAFAPENFRKIIQRQIAATVSAEVDSIVKFSKVGSDGRIVDGRFSSTRPVKTQKLANANGYFYFIVGFSRIGDLSVAAP